MTATIVNTAVLADAQLISLGAVLDLAIEGERKLFALMDRQDGIAPVQSEHAIFTAINAPVDALTSAILDIEPRTMDGWMVQARAIRHRDGADVSIAALPPTPMMQKVR